MYAAAGCLQSLKALEGSLSIKDKSSYQTLFIVPVIYTEDRIGVNSASEHLKRCSTLD